MISAGPSFFSARDRETKKAREREEIKARKGESADHEEKKSEIALFPSFAAQHWKSVSRAQSHATAGKARLLSKVYVCYI